MDVISNLPAFDLVGVDFDASGKKLLDTVTLQIPKGKLTAILGSNGAGKSTLVKLLAGQLAPTRGQLNFFGQSLTELSPLTLARSRSVLPQATAVPFAFSVEEIVRLGRSPHGDISRSAPIIERCLSHVDALHLRKRAVNTLSGGEAQRVHLARALCQIDGQPSPTILLDEPTSALDPYHQHHVLDLVHKNVAGGTTAIAVLHDLNLALQYADTAILLERGKVLASGPINQVLTAESIRSAFNVEPYFTTMPHTRTRAVLLTKNQNALPNANESH